MIEIVTALGFVTALCAGWIAVLLAIYGLVLCSNRLSHLVLGSYGGWKTFLEFQKWYAENEGKENQNAKN